MATLLEEGFWPCTVLGGEAGDADGVIKARINVRFDDGPNKGRVGFYEDKVDARSSLYVSRSMKAVGWKGARLTTFADDVANWIKETGGRSTAEVKHIPIKNGPRAGQTWDKINSIGRGPKPLNAPSGRVLADAEEALRNAMAEDGGGETAGGGGDPDEIPFASCDIALEPSPIAKVLR